MAISDPAYRAFLARLVEARLDANLTQKEVAARLRKPQSYVSKSELGERRLDVIELLAFAKVYDRSLDWFATGNAKRLRRG